jgi:formylmethanofuran dehydrogenase subunit E
MVREYAICGMSLSDLLVRMEEFHGYRSPGLLLGGMMLDSALRELGETPYLNVVTETVVCLPDAVQLLTPCTTGNGFLQVLDWGKFALAAYDRMTLSGVRVWLKPDALTDFPLISQWFDRANRPPEKPPFDELASEIMAAGETITDQRPVCLHRALKEAARVPTGRCPECGEFYALRLGPACPACRQEGYYDYQEAGWGDRGRKSEDRDA